MSQPAAGLNPAHVQAAHDEHSSFIKTPQQLLVVLLLSFVVPIIGIVMLVYFVVAEHGIDPAALEPGVVAARIKPVGALEVVDANAPKVVRSGEEIVKTVCGACHTTGAANAPKIGDKASWGARLNTSLTALTQSAIKGKGAMPPRGGVPDLSDLEIARAIVFMANQSGASFKEPPAAAGAPAPAAAAPAAAAAAPTIPPGSTTPAPSSKGSSPTSTGTKAAAPVTDPGDPVKK
jgi:cytochrome c5